MCLCKALLMSTFKLCFYGEINKYSIGVSKICHILLILSIIFLLILSFHYFPALPETHDYPGTSGEYQLELPQVGATETIIRGIQQCGFCGRICYSRSDMVKHQRIHTGEKPYKCEKCGKSYRTTSHLNRHKVTHALEEKKLE